MTSRRALHLTRGPILVHDSMQNIERHDFSFSFSLVFLRSSLLVSDMKLKKQGLADWRIWNFNMYI